MECQDTERLEQKRCREGRVATVLYFQSIVTFLEHITVSLFNGTRYYTIVIYIYVFMTLKGIKIDSFFG